MKTALVVDDSRVVRMVARRLLERQSFTVTEAQNGQEALAACYDAMPDMILLDWNMPVMNGLEFLKSLRASPGGTTPKVIFCTTMNDIDHITQALSLGADEYIMKPFDADILNEKLEVVGLIQELSE
ncbi:MAG: response regulator [Pseudomonadota bacterium]|jgi:two-component system chemotaxis response regulator CheY|nr:response regulator [Hyphomicrobiales bacterium]